MGDTLPEIKIAYETWGHLNSDKSNAILLHTGLSASSHAKSHEKNTNPGWWEKIIGPGRSIDTNKFFVICTNVLGGCYGDFFLFLISHFSFSIFLFSYFHFIF